MAELRVLHVLPSDVARGAQVYARALRDRLDRPGRTHRLLVLFGRPDEPGVFAAADYRPAVPSGAPRRYGFDPRAARVLRRAVRAFGPHVVVAHGGEALKYAALARPGRPGLVYLAIGTVSASAHRFPRRAMYRALCRRASMVVGVSEEVVEESAALFGVPARRLRLIPNGRDPEVFSPRPAAEAPGEGREPVVGFVGALTQGKRPGRFVAVVAALRARGLRLRAVAAGEGPMAEALGPMAEEAGVEMVGASRDVPGLLRSFDVLLFTSAPEGEGMPGVLVEAGLSGVPVVATDVPGVSTVVDPGRSGVVVPVEDLGAMVDATAALLEEPARRARMGAAAREWCAARFSLATGAAEWERLLEEVARRDGDRGTALGRARSGNG